MKTSVYPSDPEFCAVGQQVPQQSHLGTTGKMEEKSEKGFKSLTKKSATNKTQTEYIHLAFLGLPVRLSFVQTIVFSQQR